MPTETFLLLANFIAAMGMIVLGIALPVFWTVLGEAGNSNAAERIALVERF